MEHILSKFKGRRELFWGRCIWYSGGLGALGETKRLEKWIGWKGTLWNSTKANVKSCIWDEITCAAVQTGGSETESSFQEKDLWTAGQWYAFAAKAANHTLSCTSKSEDIKSMEGILPLYSAPKSAHTLSSYDLSSTRKTMKDWNESREESAWLLGVWRTWHMRRCWENWLCSALREGGKGRNHTIVFT